MIVVDVNILLYAMIECDTTPLAQEPKVKIPTGARHRISGYDAQYVALAQTLGVILVTADCARPRPTLLCL